MQAAGNRQDILAIDGNCKLHRRTCGSLLQKSSLLLTWTSCCFEAATPDHMVATYSDGNICRTGIAPNNIGQKLLPVTPQEGLAYWWWYLSLRNPTWRVSWLAASLHYQSRSVGQIFCLPSWVHTIGRSSSGARAIVAAPMRFAMIYFWIVLEAFAD